LGGVVLVVVLLVLVVIIFVVSVSMILVIAQRAGVIAQSILAFGNVPLRSLRGVEPTKKLSSWLSNSAISKLCVQHETT
jgi:hypothetical protein